VQVCSLTMAATPLTAMLHYRNCNKLVSSMVPAGMFPGIVPGMVLGIIPSMVPDTVPSMVSDMVSSMVPCQSASWNYIFKIETIHTCCPFGDTEFSLLHICYMLYVRTVSLYVLPILSGTNAALAPF